jgi:hypothetical protein
MAAASEIESRALKGGSQSEDAERIARAAAVSAVIFVSQPLYPGGAGAAVAAMGVD